MEGKGMNTEEQNIINKLLDIMKEQNMREQARSMEEVTHYILEMQVQLAMVTNELQGIKEQLNQIQSMQAQNTRLRNIRQRFVKEKEDVTKSVQNFEGKITQLSSKISDAKNYLVETAANAVNAFKNKGRQAMNTVLQSGIAGIRSRLQDTKVSLADTIAAYANTADRINSVGNELKQVGNSFANIGRIFSGKETKAVELSEGVAFTRAINRPIKHSVSKKNEFMKKIDSALKKLDEVSNSLNDSLGTPIKPQKEETAEKKEEEKEPRESIKDKLSQMKEKAESKEEQEEPQKEKKQEVCL